MKFKNGITEKNIVVKCGADKILPFSLVFGIYIILFGTISPGGGFQGGVIAASGILLLYIGYGYSTASKAVKQEVLRVCEPIGAVLYVILGLCGIVLGTVFCRNVFFANGKIGDLVSAGNITFMGWTVGFKVLTGIGFLILLMLALLAPEFRKKDSGEEGELMTDEEESRAGSAPAKARVHREAQAPHAPRTEMEDGE